MRVWVTGGSGFVGSNIVAAATAGGHDVLATVFSNALPDALGATSQQVDMLDPEQVGQSIASYQPDAVIHCAILNDWGTMYADRRLAWDSYVGATESTAASAADAGAAYVLVSTDWVFDGTQSGADEETPPNPVNLYGVLKLASEQAALMRGGAVARVSGVNGLHKAQPSAPRSQDPGFGYFAASIVDALGRGQPFDVWESPTINMVATPSLASQCGELMLDIAARRLDGVFHLCGADATERMELARLTCDVFDLDPSLLRSTPPPPEAMPEGGSVPYDTSLTTPRTDALLERSATPVRALLDEFRREYEQAA